MALTSITVEEVCAIIGIEVPDEGTPDGTWIRQAVKAINALAADASPRIRTLPDGEDWPDDIRTGLMMWAQRLFARRNSPTGIAAFSEMSGPVFVARWDPDVERLLRIGGWTPGAVG
ncbi:hypothetical protein [Catenulispora rubra]|uniref:hypothetical protein n=1 Tax=Catenulispora rubra TaxID=280293 RepID=UPI00189259A9|nr:hypothetical protein [Catenulispora rubra]